MTELDGAKNNNNNNSNNNNNKLHFLTTLVSIGIIVMYM